MTGLFLWPGLPVVLGQRIELEELVAIGTAQHAFVRRSGVMVPESFKQFDLACMGQCGVPGNFGWATVMAPASKQAGMVLSAMASLLFREKCGLGMAHQCRCENPPSAPRPGG